MNIQPAEQRVPLNPDVPAMLDVVSIFYTIQGEGPFAGRPAVFIRLAGCNLQCPGCDTNYTEGRRMIMPADIDFADLGISPGAFPLLVVITGGEPFRQPEALVELIDCLLHNDCIVQIETNGTLGVPELWFHRLEHMTTMGALTVVCSPKAGKVHPTIQELVHCGLSAYKYVLHADSVSPVDGLPLRALDHPAPRQGVARPDGAQPHEVYLQPYDSGDPVENARHLEAVKRSCMTYGYRLCLQQHKILNME